MNGATNWIWMDSWTAEDKEWPVLVLFRKTLDLEKMPRKASLRVSADSRYKLYINGSLAEIGPSRGDSQVWFFDEVDICPYLEEGENIIAVQVLRYPQIHSRGNHGIFRTDYPGLFVQGTVEFTDGKQLDIDADYSWKVRKDSGFHIVSESDVFAPLQIYEDYTGSSSLQGWMHRGYDDISWEPASEYPNMSRAVSPGNLFPRTIPFLYRKDRTFNEVVVLRKSQIPRLQWENLLREKQPVTIPPQSEEIIEISAGEEMTGYLHLSMQSGRGADLTILQSECYVTDEKKSGNIVKGQRDDWKSGHLEGFRDVYHAAGYGTEKCPEEYEPFWFRTFRYIRLEIRTKDEPLIIGRFSYTETGYPLDVRTEVGTSDPAMYAIWEMSERTLRRCMHETYEDCPFYEQLQYAMDARQQILYTYAVSADDRLARKCMDDFRRSQRYDGLLNCSYPNYGPNVIPGFSIYYILMLYDHMMYFGDKDFLERHMSAVEGILYYFHSHQENGLVKKTGGLNGDRFWSFIDWTPEWEKTTGVPPAVLSGPVTMESLLYIMGLQAAAGLMDYLGRRDGAEQYRKRAECIKKAVRARCTGADGMLQDGPGIEQYSQHTQVFAALTDTVGTEQARHNLLKTTTDVVHYTQCSVAMAFYLYRALEKTGLYEQTERYWNIWKRMLDKGASTCVENNVDERSECHAWGALVLYELPSVIMGIRPAKPGYQAVCIDPHPGGLKWFAGDVVTPLGNIHIEWNEKDGQRIKYTIEDDQEVVLGKGWKRK